MRPLFARSRPRSCEQAACGIKLEFQQRHYALFVLAAATALAFGYVDALFKGHQMRYYAHARY
jgi:hypothetical protein